MRLAVDISSAVGGDRERDCRSSESTEQEETRLARRIQ